MITSDILALAALVITVGGAIIALFINIKTSIAILVEKVDGTHTPRIEKLEINDEEHYNIEKGLDRRVTILETQHQKSL
jgi:hypothetical protein